jgi:predicted transcriptional regulator
MTVDENPGGSVKERIRAAVESFPGIHLRGIVRYAETSTALARYHLDALVRENVVREVRVGGFTRYFPKEQYGELTPKQRQILQLLRQERPLEIVLAILEHGPMQHRDILEFVGGSKGTLSYQLDKLIAADVLRKVPKGPEKGFHLVDPEGLRKLLSRYEPVPEIYKQVNDLWEDLFRGHREDR